MFTFIISNWEAIAAITASLATLVTVSVRHLRKVKRYFEAFEREFKPNGGTSMKDQLNRIESGVMLGEARGRALCCMMDAAMIEFDGKGNCTWVSEAWQQLTGIDLDHAMGHGWRNAIAVQQRGAVLNEWDRSLADQRMFRMTFRLHHNSHDVEAIVEPVTDSTGKVVGCIGTFTKHEHEKTTHQTRPRQADSDRSASG